MQSCFLGLLSAWPQISFDRVGMKPVYNSTFFTCNVLLKPARDNVPGLDHPSKQTCTHPHLGHVFIMGAQPAQRSGITIPFL